MGFGEVGETGMQSTDGYASNAHGAGHFDSTQLLERMTTQLERTWAVSSPAGEFYRLDVDKYLREYARNALVLNQFHYYRSDIEVTIRLVTTQFYYGSIVATLFPSNQTGDRVDERMVLDPTEISACTDQAVIKCWSYSWPFAWKRTDGTGVDDHPTNLVLDILAPLKRAKDSMPDSITVVIWLRFKNIQLSYPKGATSLTLKYEAQGKNYPVVYQKKRSKNRGPGSDASASTQTGTTSSIDRAISAVSNITLGDMASGIESVAESIVDDWGPLAAVGSFFFDKPDRDVAQQPIIIEPSIDLFNADIPDSNVSVSMYKARYVDPGSGRMPMTKNWTVSSYARIPGLRRPQMTFTTEGNYYDINLLQYHSDGTSYKIPLDYSWLSSVIWRGSIKVLLQFRTSAFISARFSVNFINTVEYPSSYPVDYSNGLTKIINVKGDTHDMFTLPWLSSSWWSEGNLPQIRIKVETPIVSSDVTLDPLIYCLCWVSGGEDIQFSFPRIPRASEWNGGDPPVTTSPTKRALPVTNKGKSSFRDIEDGPDWLIVDKAKAQSGSRKPPLRVSKIPYEKQTAIAGEFSRSFAPICENVVFDIDKGFCTAENLGPVTDVCKRYGFLTVDGASNTGFDATILDRSTKDPANYLDVQDFRHTFFGSWRAAFLFRSGGFRFRHATDPGVRHVYEIGPLNISGRVNDGTLYTVPTDNMARLSVPQLSIYPFAVLGEPIQRLSVNLMIGTSEPLYLAHPRYVAARDDVQLGYPILPSGLFGLF